MKEILVHGDEPVLCVVLGESSENNRQAVKNALRSGGSVHRMVMIGSVELIAATLHQFAMTPEEVDCAPVGTPVPVGANVLVFNAAEA